MHVQLLARKVTSNTHVRSSSSSSKLNHSWAVSGSPLSLATAGPLRSQLPQLVQQLARGEQALPELVHVHLFVGGVYAVVAQADPEKQHGRAEYPAQCFLGAAAAFPCEQRGDAPDPLDRGAQGCH